MFHQLLLGRFSRWLYSIVILCFSKAILDIVWSASSVIRQKVYSSKTIHMLISQAVSNMTSAPPCPSGSLVQCQFPLTLLLLYATPPSHPHSFLTYCVLFPSRYLLPFCAYICSPLLTFSLCPPQTFPSLNLSDVFSPSKEANSLLEQDIFLSLWSFVWFSVSRVYYRYVQTKQCLAERLRHPGLFSKTRSCMQSGLAPL